MDVGGRQITKLVNNIHFGCYYTTLLSAFKRRITGFSGGILRKTKRARAMAELNYSGLYPPKVLNALMLAIYQGTWCHCKCRLYFQMRIAG